MSEGLNNLLLTPLSLLNVVLTGMRSIVGAGLRPAPCLFSLQALACIAQPER